MEKKIIEYKFKTGMEKFRHAVGAITGVYWGDEWFTIDVALTSLLENLRKAGVLDLWFDPVYEGVPKYKAGDWVLYDSILGDGMNLGKEETIQLLAKGDYDNISGLLENNHLYNFVVNRGNYHLRISSKGIKRLATPEEIEAAQREVITLRCEGGTFEIEVSKKGIYYRPEDKWLEVADLRSAISFTHLVRSSVIGSYEFTPSHINSGCKKAVPVFDWLKVIRAYDRLK